MASRFHFSGTIIPHFSQPLGQVFFSAMRLGWGARRRVCNFFQTGSNALPAAWRDDDVSLPDYDDVHSDCRSYCDECESGQGTSLPRLYHFCPSNISFFRVLGRCEQGIPLQIRKGLYMITRTNMLTVTVDQAPGHGRAERCFLKSRLRIAKWIRGKERESASRILEEIR